MSLTYQERAFVKKCFEEYPKGIPASAWGYGPMAVVEHEDCEEDCEDCEEFPVPKSFSVTTCTEYG